MCTPKEEEAGPRITGSHQSSTLMGALSGVTEGDGDKQSLPLRHGVPTSVIEQIVMNLI